MPKDPIGHQRDLLNGIEVIRGVTRTFGSYDLYPLATNVYRQEKDC